MLRQPATLKVKRRYFQKSYFQKSYFQKNRGGLARWLITAAWFNRALHRLISFFLITVLGLGFSLGYPALSAHFPQRSPASPVPLQVTLSQAASDNNSLLQQGIRQYEVEQYAAAIDIWTQALSALTNHPSDQLNRALILSNLSLAYQHLGQWLSAEDAINESLSQLQSVKDRISSQAYFEVLAKALNTQGRLQWARGHSDIALDIWQQATAAYQQVSNIVGTVGGLMNQAKALQALGLTLQAKNHLTAVSQLLQQQSDSSLKTTGLRNLGNILRQLGELESSRRKLQESLAIATQNSAERGAILMDLGNTERALGDQAISIGQKPVAQTHFQTALSLYQQAASTETNPNSLLPLQAQLNQLRLLVETRQWSLANSLWLSLRTAAYDLPASRTAIEAQLNLTQSLIRLKETGGQTASPNESQASLAWREVADLIANTLQKAQTLQDARAESYALGQLGHVYEMTRQWQAAQTLTQQALLKAEHSAAFDIRYQWEWQLGRLLKQQGHQADAIASYQTAVSTLESIRRDLLVINSDVQFSFRDNVEPIYRELIALLVTADGGKPLSQTLLRRAIQAVDNLQLAELQNFLHCGLPTAIEISEQQFDPNAAVFYPIILPDQLMVIVKLPHQDELQYYATPLSKETLEQTLDSLRQALEQRYVSPQGVALSQQVYDWLVRPVESALIRSQAETLVFVLDGSLRNIPIAALHDGQHYLIENYAVALTPSRRLLPPQVLSQNQPRALTFGLSEIRSDFPAHQGFSSIPAVETELAQIQAQIPGQGFLNQDFTSATLQNKVSALPFSIVHLATHGQFSSNLEHTFLLAWDKKIEVHELNALLQSRTQTNAKPIELLVLSACETAAGDHRATLGLAGIAIRSGARSTLASLWAVNDQSTALLMGRFYEALTTADSVITKAAALRQAQLALMHIKGYEAPRFWSPYVLVGNWL